MRRRDAGRPEETTEEIGMIVWSTAATMEETHGAR